MKSKETAVGRSAPDSANGASSCSDVTGRAYGRRAATDRAGGERTGRLSSLVRSSALSTSRTVRNTARRMDARHETAEAVDVAAPPVLDTGALASAPLPGVLTLDRLQEPKTVIALQRTA